MSKQLKTQEVLNQPLRLKSKLTVVLTTQIKVLPERNDLEEKCVFKWKTFVRGILWDDPQKERRIFLTFLRSKIFESDREINGPEIQLTWWMNTDLITPKTAIR